MLNCFLLGRKRVQTIIHKKVSFNCVNDVWWEAVMIIFCCFAECEILRKPVIKWPRTSEQPSDILAIRAPYCHPPTEENAEGNCQDLELSLGRTCGLYVRHNWHSLFRNLKRTPTSELVRSWPLYSQPPKQAFLRELVFRPSSTENNIPFPLFYSRGNYWRS